jgi:DNA-directed RNA polymerase specialized sigma24 family protein
MAKPKGTRRPTSTKPDHSLWVAYWLTRSYGARNAIFEYHWPWVTGLVTTLLRQRCQLRHLDEVLSAVALRLLDCAIPTYDPACGGAVRTHFFMHVTYSTLSALLAATSPSKARQRAQAALVANSRANLAQTLGRRPTDAEVASALSWIEQEVVDNDPEQSAWPGRWKAFDGDTDGAITDTDRADWGHLVSGLKPESAQLLHLMYWYGYTDRQIAATLGKSHAAIGRARNAILRFLHKKLTNTANSA